MKMNRNLYLFATALVAGTVGMTSCSNEEITPDNVNPTYNGESVKTQFAINIPAAGKTRMTADIVQETGNFRGMTNIKLIPFDTKPSTGKEVNLGQVISLGDIESLITTSNAKVYSDVAIPVGTGAVLFYGQAKTTGADDFANGKVTAPTDYSVLSNVKFTPVSITTNTLVDERAENLAGWMTNVAKAENWNSASTLALQELRTEYLKATAGSSNSVLRLMQYLYDAVVNISGNDATIATAIKTAITTEPGVQDIGGTLSFDGETLAGYPGNINLPDGAAKVQWNGAEFEVVDTYGNTGLNAASLDSYVYPAPLCYYANSMIKTSNTAVDMSLQTDWSTILTGLTENPVSSTTRSIAITEAIDYGVGRLDLQIICDAQRLPDYKDNGSNNSVVDVPTKGFTVTGILIGGQGEVGWDYVPAETAGTKTIYDKTMTSGMCAKYQADFNGAITNYTLAFETYQNKDVNVAVELINNSGRDFYGQSGEIIPKDGKFYLIGTLSAAEASKTDSKVFKQDYRTIAKFTIKTLKYAYNTLPDLRTPELQLGLSVNLDWEEGYTYNVAIQ